MARRMPVKANAEAPSFGHASLPEWPLEPGLCYLNHGAYGVAPKAVLAAQDALRLRIEGQPARFLLRELRPALRHAADEIGSFLGASGDDLVFVENATTGINAVLQSFPLEAADEMLISDQPYGAIQNAAAFACRRAGALLRHVRIPFPLSGAEQVVEALSRAIGPKTRLAILDHVTSGTGLVLPVAELAALCRERGVRVLVDGAHAPGMLDLDIPSIGADWYVGNLHKWLFVPRSAAVLWAGKGARRGLHPAVVSWGFAKGYHEDFAWTGTRDPTACLAAPAGIAFMRRLGPERVRRYNRDLAWRGAERLAALANSRPGAPHEMAGAMVLAPLSQRFGTGRRAGEALRHRLLLQHQIEIPVVPRGRRLWLRLATQVYNETADIERLIRALEA